MEHSHPSLNPAELLAAAQTENPDQMLPRLYPGPKLSPCCNHEPF
jgi:hypothetical protein